MQVPPELNFHKGLIVQKLLVGVSTAWLLASRLVVLKLLPLPLESAPKALESSNFNQNPSLPKLTSLKSMISILIHSRS